MYFYENANLSMWDFICELLPVLAFLSGTLLGGLIISLFNRERRKSLEKQYRDSANTNKALESQLTSKSRLDDDLARTNTEIEKLREQISQFSSLAESSTKSLQEENRVLKNRIKKQKEFKPSTNYVNEYQVFLADLEKSIKKAKKKSLEKPTSPPKKEKKKVKLDKKKKQKSKKQKNSKYDFYKKKFAQKSLSKDLLPDSLTSELEFKAGETLTDERDFTYLYGINTEIQDILYKNGIKTFGALSLTKIAKLNEMLSNEGEKYENVNPLNWPIQARIAEKGQWEILDEYKSKMNM